MLETDFTGHKTITNKKTTARVVKSDRISVDAAKLGTYLDLQNQGIQLNLK
jgi:hypothetical protein